MKTEFNLIHRILILFWVLRGMVNWKKITCRLSSDIISEHQATDK